MTNIWKQWCRICGYDDTGVIDIFMKTEESHLYKLTDAIEKFLSISITENDEVSTKICEKCNNLIKDFTKLTIQTEKIQEMYRELSSSDKFKINNNKETEQELRLIRTKYDLKINNQMHVAKQNISDRKESLRNRNVNIKTENDSNELKNNLIGSTSTDSSSQYFSNQLDKDIKTETDALHISSLNSKKKRIKTQLQEEHEVNKKSRGKNYYCEICKQGFVKKGIFAGHMRKLHSIGCSGFPCRYCGKICKAEVAREDHENTHLPIEERKYRACDQCDKKFTSFGGYWLHMKTFHDDSNKAICDECGREFSTKRALKSHKFTHTEERPHQCPQCPARFKHIVGYKAHMETHGENHPCSICGVLLSTRYNLKKHMICHNEEKKFKCNFCQKEFKRVKSLNCHLVIHIGIKPYECRICDAKFVHDVLLRRHIKSLHPIEYHDLESTGGTISKRNYPSIEEFKAINERAAKNPESYTIVDNKS